MKRWLFDLALLAFPRAFRARFGEEMRNDFERGRGGTFFKLLANGFAERRAAMTRWSYWPAHKPHLYQPPVSWDHLRADVRHTLRQAIRAPFYTALTVMALALGIGANSAIFTVVKAVLLEPLPYRNPDELVMAWSRNTKEDKPFNAISPANFIDYRDGVKDLARLEGFVSFFISSQMRASTGSERLVTAVVGTGLFDVLGIKPILGRTFAPGESNVAVLSYGFWQRRFGGDPAVIGRQITSDSTQRTIVGVMPDGFVFPYPTMLGPDGFTRISSLDMWVPWVLETDTFARRGGVIVRDVHYLAAIGRLHGGANVKALRARLETIAARLAQAYPASNSGWGASVVPIHEQAVGSVRPALLMLLAGVGLVLLMASVNVANLAPRPQHEPAARTLRARRARSRTRPVDRSVSHRKYPPLHGEFVRRFALRSLGCTGISGARPAISPAHG